MDGTSLDVVEMDAASNNSVDDIRELRENVALAPMGGARRVYILDEAHMLSTAAWNAFLKTLEEPPRHVVFVLATTEAHKVPATIVDRCHRFDFQRPSLEQIAGVLRRVADQEDISIPDPAVGMIARKAGGSFRDALGTLEQLVTYGGNEIATEDVLAALGVADAGLILDATEALVEKDPSAALLTVQSLADSGRDYEQFMRDPPATCATCWWCRRSARCPTRSRSPPSTPIGWPPRPSASRRASCCALSTCWRPRSPRSRRAPSRASSSRSRCSRPPSPRPTSRSGRSCSGSTSSRRGCDGGAVAAPDAAPGVGRGLRRRRHHRSAPPRTPEPPRAEAARGGRAARGASAAGGAA